MSNIQSSTLAHLHGRRAERAVDQAAWGELDSAAPAVHFLTSKFYNDRQLEAPSRAELALLRYANTRALMLLARG